jgi:hypothetical protein
MFHKRAITKMGVAKYSAKWTKVTLEEISGSQKYVIFLFFIYLLIYLFFTQKYFYLILIHFSLG